MDVRERALSYLEGHNVMTLATIGPEGPWAAAVFYVTDGFTFYFLSSPATRHGRNLAAEPRVAATVQGDDADWTEIRGVQLEGEARRIEEEGRAAAVERYGEKFPVIRDPQAEIAQALDKVAWYRLVPHRLHFIDNSRGLGHREEIELP